ncbi:MAG: lipocalin family protein [Pseudomonadota bacterium]
MITEVSRRAAVLALTLVVAACSSSPSYRDASVPMTTAGPVDLARYQGAWFEIARYPNRFEEGCEGVTAEYTLLDDGTVRVVNTCREGAPDGPASSAEGIATSTNADNDRLKVSFVPWLPFAAGDYWILGLTPDYSVAVIGEPSGKFGWILARAPKLDPAALAEAEAVLTRNGYDLGGLTYTRQMGGGS